MIEIRSSSVWYPDYIAETILEIEPDVLNAIGITHIAFDLDRTLTKLKSNTIPSDNQKFIARLKREHFTVLIATNSRRDITETLGTLGTRAVRPENLSYKPFRSFFKRLILECNTSPRHIIMVGDNILNDVIGANRAGIHTVLVNGVRESNNDSFLLRAYTRSALRHAGSHT